MILLTPMTRDDRIVKASVDESDVDSFISFETLIDGRLSSQVKSQSQSQTVQI